MANRLKKKIKPTDNLYKPQLDMRSRDASDVDLNPMPKAEQPLATRDNDSSGQPTRPQAQARPTMKLKQADAASTREKLSKTSSADGSGISHETLAHLAGLRGVDDDTVSTEVAQRPTSENLPKVISKELVAHGYQFPVEWLKMTDLPGYMQSGIRTFGRQLFKELFPNSNLEDLQVVTTLGNINSKQELTTIAGFMDKFGQKNEFKTGQIKDLLPGGYNPYIAVYDYAGYSFLVVKDPMGEYIYAGPGIENTLTHESKDLKYFLNIIRESSK